MRQYKASCCRRQAHWLRVPRGHVLPCASVYAAREGAPVLHCTKPPRPRPAVPVRDVRATPSLAMQREQETSVRALGSSVSAARPLGQVMQALLAACKPQLERVQGGAVTGRGV